MLLLDSKSRFGFAASSSPFFTDLIKDFTRSADGVNYSPGSVESVGEKYLFSTLAFLSDLSVL